MGESAEDKYYREKAARDEKAAAERAEQERQNRAMGFFERLWDSFGFFELILIALVVGGLYLAAKANPEFVEKLVKHLPDSWQSTVTKGLSWLGIPVDLTETIANMPPEELGGALGTDKETVQKLFKTPEEQKAFAKKIADVNGGKIQGADALTSDKTLYMLIDEYPGVVTAMAGKFKGDKDGKLDDTAQKALASIRLLIKDGRMDTLLNKPASANALFGIMDSVNKAASGLIKEDLKNNGGKLSPGIKNLLIERLTPGADDKLPSADAPPSAAETKYLRENPEAARKAVEAAAQTDPLVKAVISNNDGKAYKALVAAMSGNEGNTVELLLKLKGSKGLEQLKLALENYAPLRAYIDNAKPDQLPKELADLAALKQISAEAVAPALRVVAKGVDPRELILYAVNPKSNKIEMPSLVENLITNAEARQKFAAAGSENIVPLAKAFASGLPDTLTPTNLNALLKATDRIGTALPSYDAKLLEGPPSQARAEAFAARSMRQNTLAVMNAFTQAIVSGKPDAVKSIKPEQLAQFAKDPNNTEAIRTLLNEVRGLPAEIRASIGVFNQHWELIAALAADEKGGAKEVLDKFAKLGVKTEGEACKAPTAMGLAASDLSNWTQSILVKLSDSDVIKNNINKIQMLSEDLAMAQCAAIQQKTAAVPKR